MQGSDSRTLVVMPAFNEEASVGNVVREVRAKTVGVDILVVDDGSSDATAREAELAGASVARLPFNLGVGGAMRLGFRWAIEQGYDNVVQIDADGQHDPSGVPLLLEQLASADLVLGARFAGKGKYQVTGPRRWAMVLLASVLSRTAGTELTDTTSGFRASGPRAVRLFAETYPAEYLGDTVEALVIAARAGLTIRQVPVEMRERAGGVPSHDPMRAALQLGRTGLALLFAMSRPRATPQPGPVS